MKTVATGSSKTLAAMQQIAQYHNPQDLASGYNIKFT
jgi:hypothetical protein